MDRARSVLVAAVLLAALSAPATAVADNPNRGQVFAVGDHVLPGGTLMIIGSQLDPGADLALRLTAGGVTIDLGTAVVAADGTIEHRAVIPASTPPGYASIQATSDTGSAWTANVLIGERPEGPGAQGNASAQIDDRVIGVTLFGLGLVVLLLAGAWYMRRGPRGSASPD